VPDEVLNDDFGSACFVERDDDGVTGVVEASLGEPAALENVMSSPVVSSRVDRACLHPLSVSDERGGRPQKAVRVLLRIGFVYSLENCGSKRLNERERAPSCPGLRVG